MEASNSNGTQLQVSTPPPSQDLTPVEQQSPAQTPVEQQSPAQTQVEVQLPAETPVEQQSPAQTQVEVQLPAETPVEQQSPAPTPVQIQLPAKTLVEQQSPAQTPVEQQSRAQTPVQIQLPAKTLVEQQSRAQTPVEQQSPAQTPAEHESPAPTPVQVELPAKTPVQIQFPAQPQAQAPSTSASSSNSQPDHVLYKSRLQQYTQKSGLPFPVYQTINEGFQHAPRFRSSVLVDGACYTSPNTFPARKAAEQDVARLAMTNITERIKDVEVPLIHEVFCKSILNEYAVKRNMEKPVYNTVQTPGLLPAFISTLVFNSVTYTGNVGKSKKEAEQLVARVVIQSLKDDSESGPIISEIIRPKYKLDAALHKIKDLQHAHAGLVPPAVNTGNSSAISTSGPIVTLPEVSFGMLPPHHEFIKRKPEEPASQATLQLPITLVPSVFEQPLGVVLTSMGISPTSLGIAPTCLDTGNSSVISTSAPIVALPDTSFGMLPPRHEFIKRKPEEPVSQINPQLPITFVPSVSEQPLGVVSTSIDISPTSLAIAPTHLDISPSYSDIIPTSLGIAPASKKSRPNEEANKISHHDAQLPVSVSLNLTLGMGIQDKLPANSIVIYPAHFSGPR